MENWRTRRIVKVKYKIISLYYFNFVEPSGAGPVILNYPLFSLYCSGHNSSANGKIPKTKEERNT